MKILDTVRVNGTNTSKFSGRIGFVIDSYKHAEDGDLRYDVQFPFEQVVGDKEKTEHNRICEQMQFGRYDMSLIQSY